jgi:hypothetical protein
VQPKRSCERWCAQSGDRASHLWKRSPETAIELLLGPSAHPLLWAAFSLRLAAVSRPCASAGAAQAAEISTVYNPYILCSERWFSAYGCCTILIFYAANAGSIPAAVRTARTVRPPTAGASDCTHTPPCQTHLPLDCHCISGVNSRYRRGTHTRVSYREVHTHPPPLDTS